jgi:hypothetical protein
MDSTFIKLDPFMALEHFRRFIIIRILIDSLPLALTMYYVNPFNATNQLAPCEMSMNNWLKIRCFHLLIELPFRVINHFKVARIRTLPAKQVQLQLRDLSESLIWQPVAALDLLTCFMMCAGWFRFFFYYTVHIVAEREFESRFIFNFICSVLLAILTALAALPASVLVILDHLAKYVVHFNDMAWRIFFPADDMVILKFSTLPNSGITCPMGESSLFPIVLLHCSLFTIFSIYAYWTRRRLLNAAIKANHSAKDK